MAEGIPAPQHCQPREAADPPLHPAAPAPPIPSAMGRAGPPHSSAPSARSGCPHRPSSPPHKGRAGRAPGALLGRQPSGRDLPAVAHPWNAPHPEGSRQQQPLSHVPAAHMPLPRLSRESSALPQTPPPPASGPALQSPTAATLCAVPQGRTSSPSTPGSCRASIGSLIPSGCPGFTGALPCSAGWEGGPSLPPWPPPHPTAPYSAPHRWHTRASPFACALTHSCAEAAVIIFSWWKSRQNIP